jgi:hypothetical protein
MSARKRASSVKNGCGFCALSAHKNRNHFLREQAPQAQGHSKATFELPWLKMHELLQWCGLSLLGIVWRQRAGY